VFRESIAPGRLRFQSRHLALSTTERTPFAPVYHGYSGTIRTLSSAALSQGCELTWSGYTTLSMRATYYQLCTFRLTELNGRALLPTFSQYTAYQSGGHQCPFALLSTSSNGLFVVQHTDVTMDYLIL